jgi:hypothetical protein
VRCQRWPTVSRQVGYRTKSAREKGTSFLRKYGSSSSPR